MVSKLVDTYTQAAQSESTRRSYAQDIQHFKSNGGKIPATPLMVAEYLAAFAGILAVSTLKHRLIAIHKIHKDRGLKSPIGALLVKTTMQGIRRTFGVAQRKVKAIVKDDLLEILVMVERQRPLKAARDKALLSIGFAGAFRRSELVALTVEDVAEHQNGLSFLIRRSKTDQEGAGRSVFIPKSTIEQRCPVRALQKWLEMAHIETGPIFRHVSRHDHLVSDSPLSAHSVARIVKNSVARVCGAEEAKHVSGHSLRSGFVTEAASVGLSTSTIMDQTGHKSHEMVYRYCRQAKTRRTAQSLL